MTTDGHNFCFMSNLCPSSPKHHHNSTVLPLQEAGERTDSGEWVLPVPHLCYLLLSLDFPYLIHNVLTICKYDGVRQQKTVGESRIKYFWSASSKTFQIHILRVSETCIVLAGTPWFSTGSLASHIFPQVKEACPDIVHGNCANSL